MPRDLAPNGYPIPSESQELPTLFPDGRRKKTSGFAVIQALTFSAPQNKSLRRFAGAFKWV